jgi:hypothetical protein
MPAHAVEHAIERDAVDAARWFVDTPGVELSGGALIYAATSCATSVLRELLPRVEMSDEDFLRLVEMSVRNEDVFGVLCAAGLETRNGGYLDFALRGGCVPVVRHIVDSLALDARSLAAHYLNDVDDVVESCMSSPDMCTFVLDAAQPPEPTVQRLTMAACEASCNDAVLVRVLEHAHARRMAPPPRECAQIACVHFNTGCARALDFILLLLDYGCPCPEAQLLAMCRLLRRRQLLAEALRGRLVPPAATT